MDWFRCWMTILQYSFNKKNPTRIEKQLRKKDHTEFPPQVEPVAIQHDDDDDDDASSREPNHSQPRSWLRLSFSSDTSLNSHYGTDTTNTRALRQSRDVSSSTMTVVIPNCPAGEYWMEHQVDNEDGFNSLNHGSTSIVGKCQSVGLGYYSPQEDGQRYPCPVGTFSDVTQADVCQECLPLYYNGLGSDYAVTLTPDTNGAPMEGLFCLQPLVAPVEVSFLDNLDTGIDGDESFSSLELDDEEGTIFSTPSEFPSSIPPTALTPTPSPTFNDDAFTLTPTWTSTSSLYPPTISPLPTLTPASNDYITASPSPTTTNVANSMPYRNSNNSMANNKDDDSNVKGGTFFSTPKRKVFFPVLLVVAVMGLVWVVFSKPCIRRFGGGPFCRRRRRQGFLRSSSNNKQKKKRKTHKTKTSSTTTTAQAWRAKCHHKPPPPIPSLSTVSSPSMSLSRSGSDGHGGILYEQRAPGRDSHNHPASPHHSGMDDGDNLAYRPTDDHEEMDIHFESTNLHRMYKADLNCNIEYSDEEEEYEDERENSEKDYAEFSNNSKADGPNTETEIQSGSNDEGF